jgi:hypothetical protein
MTLWVANDLAEPLGRCTLDWTISVGGKSVLHDVATLDVLALNATKGPTVDLHPLKAVRFDLMLVLADNTGKVISRYQKEVRCVPDSVLKAAGNQADPFKK